MKYKLIQKVEMIRTGYREVIVDFGDGTLDEEDLVEVDIINEDTIVNNVADALDYEPVQPQIYFNEEFTSDNSTNEITNCDQSLEADVTFDIGDFKDE